MVSCSLHTHTHTRADTHHTHLLELVLLYTPLHYSLLLHRLLYSLSPLQTAVSPLVRKVGSSSSSSSSSGTPSTQPHLRKGSADGSNPSTLTSPMLRRSTDFIATPPDRRAKTPGRTGIPTPSQRYPRAGATPRESRSRPTTPSSVARRAQRPKSTDPLGAYSTYRPSSSKSDYIPGYYMNGQDSLMSKYAMGRLTQLNFGDEDCECGVYRTCLVQRHLFMQTSLVAKHWAHVVMYIHTYMRT